MGCHAGAKAIHRGGAEYAEERVSIKKYSELCELSASVVKCLFLDSCFAAPADQRAGSGPAPERVFSSSVTSVSRGTSRIDLSQFLGHERLGVLADQFKEIAVKFLILERFSKSILENVDAILGRSRRDDVRRTDEPENPPHGQQLSFTLGLGEALNLGKMTELWMFGAFGHFQDGVKIHHAFIEPVGVAPQNGRSVVGARVQFAAQQRRVDLGSRVAGDKFGVL